MNRLTERTESGKLYLTPEPETDIYGNLTEKGFTQLDTIYHRLAAYEDTGLLPDEIQQLEIRLDAALKDLYYIHCAGQKGCAICHNADQCGESDSHIGDCVGFEWRGPQPKEEKGC